MHAIHQPVFYVAGILIAWHILGYVFDPVYTFFVNVLYLDLISF